MRESAIFTSATAPLRRINARILTVMGLLVALGAAAALVGPPAAESQAPTVRVLGKTPSPPRPACPATDRTSCMAVGNVTIFQSMIGGSHMPYQVPFHGKLAAWSITLSKPRRSEVRGFDDFYGRPSQARISVLRPVGKKRPPIYKMVRQSPIQELNRFFGRTVHFALERPLNVRRGQIIALTIPTWAPNWAVNLDNNNAWRASRHSKRCDDSDIQEYSRPQQKVGSNRQYGCYFTNTRFLYTATVVRDPSS